MAATIANALKLLIEGGGLGLSAYRDDTPAGATLPLVLIHEGISVVPDPSNARHDRAGGRNQVREQVQVSLWQAWHDAEDGNDTESYTLPDALAELLDGAVLPASGSAAPPKHVWGVRLLAAPRIVDRTQNRVHHPMTIEVVRDF